MAFGNPVDLPTQALGRNRLAPPNSPKDFRLSDAIERLGSEIESLNGLLGVLADRLQTVMRPVPPVAEDGRVSPSAPKSSTMCDVDRLMGRVIFMRQGVSEVLDRLEV